MINTLVYVCLFLKTLRRKAQVFVAPSFCKDSFVCLVFIEGRHYGLLLNKVTACQLIKSRH